VIASRRSALARAQAEAVGRVLAKLHSHVQVQFVWIDSEGDQHPEAKLNEVGGKGLFAKAIERAVLSGKADLAVHSLKDLPTQLTPGLAIAAIPKRGEVADCLIAPEANSIDQLPVGAIVGTSSPRRAAQLLHLRNDLTIRPIRGNVETRLKKVSDEKLFHATLLAVAGLQRSGLSQHAVKVIPTDTVLPSSSQGALALQCRTDDHVTLSRCLPLNHPGTAAAVQFERAVVEELAGDCHSPIAVLAEPSEDAATFRLRARVLSPDGAHMSQHEMSCTSKELSKAGPIMVAELNQRGAQEMLRGHTQAPAAPITGAQQTA